MTVVNLLKQAFYITHILVCVLGRNKQEETEAIKLISRIEEFFSIFKSNQPNKMNDSKSLFSQIKLIFGDFKSIFNDLNVITCSKQSEWKNCYSSDLQQVLNQLLDFIDNSNNEAAQFDKIDHVAMKLVTKSKSFSSLVEEIETFGNDKFNVETQTNESPLLETTSQAQAASTTLNKPFSFSGFFTTSSS